VVAWAQERGPADALAEAARKCDGATIKALLDRGVSPDTRDGYGETPLIIAVGVTSRCDAAVVKVLLDKGAGVNLRDTRGDTALIRAMVGHASERSIIGSSQAVVQLLIDHGAELNARNNEGRTALSTLADQFAEQTGIMRLLLDHGAGSADEALLPATRHGHTGEVRLLLDRHANVNGRDGKGRTALMEAARCPDIAVLKELIGRGADLYAVDQNGHPAAWFAATAGYPDRVALLHGTTGDRQTALNRGLLRVIGEGNEKGVEALLQQGADPNANSEEGTPALVSAAGKSYAVETVRLLLDHDARVDAADRDGKTALMVAAKAYAMKMVGLLLDKGAKLGARDRQGSTALLAATCASAFPDGRAALVELLLDHGADARVSNADGVNAVMLAARCGNPALPALVEKGADVNASDTEGKTALMIASTQGDEGVVRFLLEKGADVRARDKAGRSVLLTAIDAPANFSYDNQARYSYEIASLLVMRGADVNAAAANGDTAVKAGVRRGYSDIVRLLIERGAKQVAR
jgi:ankyrin repeat protein